MGRPKGATGNAPTLSGQQFEHFAVPFGITNYKMPDSSLIINATNTCCLDSCLTGLALHRWYDVESSLFMEIKRNKILYYVLDQVQRGDYDAARCSWISYTLSQISNSSIVKEKKNSDCGMMQHWNCESSTYSNLAMMKNLFQFTVRDEFGGCSNGELACEHMQAYEALEDKSRDSFIIYIPGQFLPSIAMYINHFYNAAGENVQCGQGTDMHDDDGKFNCSGTRDYQKKLITFPPILMIENQDAHQMTQDTAVSNMTTMASIDHEIFINGERYVLIQAFLANGSHFRSVVVVYGKYLWYDSIGKQMKWISKTDDLTGGRGEHYFVSCLWYRHAGSCRGHTLAQGKNAVLDELKSFNPRAIKDDGKSPPQKKLRIGTVPKQNNTVQTKKGKSQPQQKSSNNAVSKSSNMSNNKKRKSPPQKKLSNNSAKKKHKPYPMGLSIKDVSKHGVPNCRYCRTNIEAGKWHAINKIKNNTNNDWNDERHYHFRCASEILSQEDMKQLTIIVKASKDVGKNELDELLNGIE